MPYYDNPSAYGNDTWLANNGGMAVEDIDYLMEGYDSHEDLGWDYTNYDVSGGEALVRYGSSGGSSFDSVPSPEYYTYGTPTATIDPNLIQNYDLEPYGSSIGAQSPPVTQAPRQRYYFPISLLISLYSTNNLVDIPPQPPFPAISAKQHSNAGPI